ncbi:MAG: response regulator [Longimicrobiaceae bacterium]
MTTVLRTPPYRVHASVRDRGARPGSAGPGWARDPSPAEAGSWPQHAVAEKAGRLRCRVLVVDDDDGYREVLASALETLHGAVVEQAAGGAMALALVERDRRFDLVLLDVTMPGLDGPAVYAEMRECGVDCPIVLMSADCTAEIRARAQALGVALFDKPVPNGTLRRILVACGGGEAS